MPKRTRAEIDSDEIDSVFDLILNAVDYSPGLTAIKKRLLSDISFKKKTIAATDFTMFQAIETFGLKYVENLDEFSRNHEWDIEKDVGKEEFQTTPCIGETLIPSC